MESDLPNMTGTRTFPTSGLQTTFFTQTHDHERLPNTTTAAGQIPCPKRAQRYDSSWKGIACKEKPVKRLEDDINAYL